MTAVDAVLCLHFSVASRLLISNVGCLKANKYETFLRSKKTPDYMDMIKKGENKRKISRCLIPKVTSYNFLQLMWQLMALRVALRHATRLRMDFSTGFSLTLEMMKKQPWSVTLRSTSTSICELFRTRIVVNQFYHEQFSVRSLSSTFVKN